MTQIVFKGGAGKKDRAISSIAEFLDAILSDYKKGAFEVGIVFCKNSFIKKINRQYRNIDEPTDVLAFSMLETVEEDRQFRDSENEQEILGDIIISTEQAKIQAKEFGVPEHEELARLAIHGILHLLGYDHEKSGKDQKIMFKKQDAYLDKFLKKYY